MQLLNWCKRYIKVLTVIFVLLVVYFFWTQDISISQYYHHTRTIDSLEKEIAVHTDTMNYYHNLNHRLSTDPQIMERVVREQYNMNRTGEDVYVFE